MTDILDSPPRQHCASFVKGKNSPPLSNHHHQRRPKPPVSASAAASAAMMTEPRSSYNSPLRRSNCINNNTGGRIFYNSPRIDTPDELLFPAATAAIASSERGVAGGDHDTAGPAAGPASSSVAAPPAAGALLSDSLARWRYMAELAGRHCQPHDILRVNLDRVSAPAALVAGMPSRIGSLIQTLHLPLADDASQLPEWLDAIATAFPNLQHLHLNGDEVEHDDDDDDDDVQKEVEKDKDNEPQAKDKEVETGSGGPPGDAKAGLIESDHKPKTLSDEVLVRRLYVLYRLPRLQSMDGEPFSEQEQKLARPRDHRRPQADDEDSPAVTDKNNDDNGPLVEQQQQEERQQKQRRPSGGPLSKELNESCLLDDSSDEDEGEAVVHHKSNENAATLPMDGEVEIGLNGRPMAMSSCDPDRWEAASIESGAVACEWACGSLSLPYFQRNDETTGRQQKQQRKKSKKSQRQPRLTVRTRSDGGVVGGRRPRPQQQQQEPPPPSKQHRQRQTSMPLNQFTFEDSIEIDNAVSTVLERCLRVSTPPNEKALVMLEHQHQHNESPVSSSSSSHSRTGSQKSNQENVVVSLRPPPPTRSLTSPFPMQFRSTRGVTERVDKLIGAISEESEHTLETVDSHQTATIIPLMRIHSSPSNLSMKPLAGGKKNRPPPCPGRRAPLGSRPQRTKRRQNRWRERLNARSNSILDDDDEDEDDDINDDAEEDEQQQKEDSGQSEKEAAMLQPKGLRLT